MTSTRRTDTEMPLRLIILITAFVLIIFSMHWAFFKSAACFFGISRPPHKAALYAAMVLLTAVVISGFISARAHDAWWVTGYYGIAATWMGFLVHFLAAAAAVWIVILAVHLARIPIGRSTVAAVFFIAAGIYSIYGIFNAFSPRIREVPVYLEAVPAAWENSRIVHLSDLHIGRLHGKAFAEKLVMRVNALAPDLVVITGDIFDGLGGDFDTLVTAIDGFEAKNGVFYVSGNHEAYIGKQRALELLKNTSMTRLDNERIEIDGLDIVGVSYPGIRAAEEIANLPEAPENNKNPRILLFHTPTSIMKPGGDRVDRHFATYWMPDTDFYHNRKIGIDLQLSGHTHHGQIFPINRLTGLLYRGFDYGLKQSGGLQIYITSGAGTWGPPMRTATISEIAVIRLREKQAAGENNDKKSNAAQGVGYER